MSLVHLQQLAVLCCVLGVAQTVSAQEEEVRSVTRRAFGPNDVGRLVDANWTPVGRTRLVAEVLAGPGNGVDREVRTSLTPSEASANASAFPAAAAMRRAQANGFVRVMEIEAVYELDRSTMQMPPENISDQFYIHAVHVGRVYQRQFYGSAEETPRAVSIAGEGEGIIDSVRSARFLRGYHAPRAADEARLLGADAGALRGMLRPRGRPTGVLVVFRRVRSRGQAPIRGRVSFPTPVEIPFEGQRVLSEPSYDPAHVNRLLQQRRAVFVRCYEQSLRANPVQRGVVVLRFTLTPDGRLTDATGTSQDVGQDIPACMATAVTRFRSTPAPTEPVRFEIRIGLAPRDD